MELSGMMNTIIDQEKSKKGHANDWGKKVEEQPSAYKDALRESGA